MAKKTPEEKAAADAAKALKELQKKAKKLKVQFDAETTAEELTILVNAAEEAVAAQEAAKGETTPPPVTPPTGDEVHQQEAQAAADSASAAPETTPAGDSVLSTHVGKLSKEVSKLVLTPDGKVQLKSRHGVVLANFDTKDNQKDNISEGLRHMENLSRF